MVEKLIKRLRDNAYNGRYYAEAADELERLLGLLAAVEEWPETPEEVRQFVGSDFVSLRYGREDKAACAEDIYTMTAHDIASAIRNWRDFSRANRLSA